MSLPAANATQDADLLTILRGRLLHIEEAKETGKDVADEVRRIVQAATASFTAAHDDEVREAALDVLAYLPVRSGNEIAFVLQLAEGAADRRVQESYLRALRRADPKTPEVQAALELGRQSKVGAVREAVEVVLKRGKG